MLNQLIINTEYFLGCAGSCAGCFLSQEERASQNNFHSTIKEKLIYLLDREHPKKGHEFLVVGLGRGNNLNLDKNSLINLGELIKELEGKYPSQKIVFEVSTSLIGKIQTQIDNAIFLLNYSRNIYFNVVVNSEIVSHQFWKNLKSFHSALQSHREDWGWTDNTGDILVLNINPEILPDIQRLKEFAQDIHSPINISLFPFNSSVRDEQSWHNLKEWTQQIAIELKGKDLNIKNHLEQYNFAIEGVSQALEHINKTKESYYFIDKNGHITNGIPSIMGEIDFPRLLDKYNLSPDATKAFKTMQRLPNCQECDYQKECLVTGAYLNMLANYKQLKDNTSCPSGYHAFFKEFKK